jgi:carbon monoxide dehydrogenase subunit G
MPRREARFEVNAPPEEVWRFIRDFESLCACIPGVERIRLVDGRTVELTVKEKVGVVPLVLDLTAKIDSEDPPHRLHATARAEHLTMEIDVSLQGTASRTELLGLLTVRGEGRLKAVVDSLFERRATERTAQFAETLEKRFAAPSAREAAPPAPAAGGGGILGWLRRLWRRLTSSS